MWCHDDGTHGTAARASFQFTSVPACSCRESKAYFAYTSPMRLRGMAGIVLRTTVHDTYHLLCAPSKRAELVSGCVSRRGIELSVRSRTNGERRTVGTHSEGPRACSGRYVPPLPLVAEPHLPTDNTHRYTEDVLRRSFTSHSHRV